MYIYLQVRHPILITYLCTFTNAIHKRIAQCWLLYVPCDVPVIIIQLAPSLNLLTCAGLCDNILLQYADASTPLLVASPARANWLLLCCSSSVHPSVCLKCNSGTNDTAKTTGPIYFILFSMREYFLSR